MKTVTKIILIFLGMIATNILAEELYNKFSPSEWWFEYYEPKVEPIIIGDTIEFTSYSEYKRDVKVHWYETLWCYSDVGYIHRGNTQYLSDFKLAGSNQHQMQHGNITTSQIEI